MKGVTHFAASTTLPCITHTTIELQKEGVKHCVTPTTFSITHVALAVAIKDIASKIA